MIRASSFVPVLGGLAGFLAVYFSKYTVPSMWAPYLSLATLAGLDSICGGIRAGLEGKFHDEIFLTGFVMNTLLSALLAYLGDRIGVDLFLAAVVLLGGRVFLNLSLIRRYWLNQVHLANQARKKNRRRRKPVAKSGDIVVGLDIGTTKVCTLIAEVSTDVPGRVDILGVGIAPSTGIRRGVVVDIEKTVRAISESVERAQRMAGADVHSAIVGVTGEHIASLNSRGVIAITHPDREVTQEDVDRVLENSRVIVLPPDREIIHVIARGFSIDGQSGIRSPVGMSGTRLEVETHVVTGATSFLRNVATCVERAGLQVEDTVLEPIATGESVLMSAEKDLGVVLVDIGGGTADLAIFRDGDITYSAVVPIGGGYVTRDISAGLRTTLEEAERVKLTYGIARAKSASEETTFSFTHLGAAEPSLESVHTLAMIIEPRAAELFQLVRREINRSNHAGYLPAGMVVSGGGAMLVGLTGLAEDIVDMPVRVGFPSGIGGLAESVSAPSFATAVGLVQWGGRAHAGLIARRDSQGSMMHAIRQWMRRVFRDVFGS